MSNEPLILALDQGTTSSRAIVFNRRGQIIASAQQEFAQHFPADGWVEHDPADLWQTTLATARSAVVEAEKRNGRTVTIGITNQRETTLVWDRETGKPIYNAIVWQDRRTADRCDALSAAGHLEAVTAKSGLLLDPYFSASKIAWILDNVPGAREKADAGKLAFGTVDTWLLWNLTAGRVHATDATNASRTSLFNIHTQSWDADLLDIFEVPENLLPDVHDCAADYGETDVSLFGRLIPVQGIAGDQQAATFGQACFGAGEAKSTYGTGCFMLMNTGDKAIRSTAKLLTTTAWRLDGKATYALEGSIFMAGAIIQWLRDGMKFFDDAAKSEALAGKAVDHSNVYLVPTFTGLGAPYWDPDARAAIYGMTRDTGPAEITRAALESVALQTADLVGAMARDGVAPRGLRVDGGMVGNDWLVQTLSDFLNVPVDRPVIMETTALGAATLAGLQAGIYNSLDDIQSLWQCEKSFAPAMFDEARDRIIAGWKQAVERTLTR